MKLEAITLREIQMPLVHFFETSFGRVYSRRILLLTAHCEGIDGWSECVAGEDPFYSSEWTESAWPVIQHYLAPAVVGRTLESARESVPRMAKVRGHQMAKAAVENALWDAEAQQKQQPLWKLLGGTRREIQCGVSIGIQDSVPQVLKMLLVNGLLHGDCTTVTGRTIGEELENVPIEPRRDQSRLEVGLTARGKRHHYAHRFCR